MFDVGFELRVIKINIWAHWDRRSRVLVFQPRFRTRWTRSPRKILGESEFEITVGGRRSCGPKEIEQIVEVRPEDTKFNRLLEILSQILTDEDPRCRTSLTRAPLPPTSKPRPAAQKRMITAPHKENQSKRQVTGSLRAHRRCSPPTLLPQSFPWPLHLRSLRFREEKRPHHPPLR